MLTYQIVNSLTRTIERGVQKNQAGGCGIIPPLNGYTCRREDRGGPSQAPSRASRCHDPGGGATRFRRNEGHASPDGEAALRRRTAPDGVRAAPRSGSRFRQGIDDDSSRQGRQGQGHPSPQRRSSGIEKLPPEGEEVARRRSCHGRRRGLLSRSPFQKVLRSFERIQMAVCLPFQVLEHRSALIFTAAPSRAGIRPAESRKGRRGSGGDPQARDLPHLSRPISWKTG